MTSIHNPNQINWATSIVSVLWPSSPTHKALEDFIQKHEEAKIPIFSEIDLDSAQPSLHMSTTMYETTEITWIRTPEISIHRLPIRAGSRGLLITRDYLSIMDWVEADERWRFDAEMELGDQDFDRGLCIIRTPGTGKSCFLLYLLLLRVSKGQETIFQEPGQYDLFYWFRDGTVE